MSESWRSVVKTTIVEACHLSKGGRASREVALVMAQVGTTEALMAIYEELQFLREGLCPCLPGAPKHEHLTGGYRWTSPTEGPTDV